MADAEALTAALRAPARIPSLRCHCGHTNWQGPSVDDRKVVVEQFAGERANRQEDKKVLVG